MMYIGPYLITGGKSNGREMFADQFISSSSLVLVINIFLMGHLKILNFVHCHLYSVYSINAFLCFDDVTDISAARIWLQTETIMLLFSLQGFTQLSHLASWTTMWSLLEDIQGYIRK